MYQLQADMKMYVCIYIYIYISSTSRENTQFCVTWRKGGRDEGEGWIEEGRERDMEKWGGRTKECVDCVDWVTWKASEGRME